ncbi:MAG: thioredoxin 1 [Clostridiales bacterium]|nr:thioredoxin 1 [Clostridiales bacterium]
MEMKFTDSNFSQEALDAKSLVVVDFYADWCGPCKMMAPVIKELAAEYEGSVKIGKLNVDENQATAQKYRVMSIPTMLFIKDGEVVDKIVGAVSKAQVVAKITAHK